jgi:hypothetical protein
MCADDHRRLAPARLDADEVRLLGALDRLFGQAFAMATRLRKKPFQGRFAPLVVACVFLEPRFRPAARGPQLQAS